MLRVNMLAVFLCWMLTILSCTCGARSIVNTLRVGTSGSTIITVVGCMERFICEGTGTEIRWRFLNTRNDLTNSTHRRIVTTTSENNMVTSHLIFNNVMPEHDATYVCIIIDANTRRTTPLSARLTVNNTKVYIEPLSDIDISNNVVGQTISFGCSIQTCEERILVSISKGSQLLKPMMSYSGENLVLINEDLTISEDTVGEYSCHVRLPDGTSFVQSFNVTGIPQRPATTTPSSMGNMNVTPTKKNGATSLFQVHSPLLFFLLLLLVTSATISMLWS